MKHIYLDNSATTKPAPEVIEAMKTAQEKFWGNPSSVYIIGQEARQILDEGRKFTSFFVGCEPEEIIFTSGGSESDNLAIRGIIDEYYKNVIPDLIRDPETIGIDPGSQDTGRNDNNVLPHVITTAIEHHAVLYTIQDLEKKGLIEATYVKPKANGAVDVKDVEAAIKENTVLVSVMYVNNETGVIQPIREIGQMLEKINQNRSVIPAKAGIQKKSILDPRVKPEDDNGRGASFGKIFLHTDAVQAGEFCHLAPEWLKVDLMSLSAHKFHGPRGVGILYIRKGTRIVPQITGGGQELKKRAGTENIAGIFGTHVALDLILKERADSGSMNEFADLPEVMSTNEVRRIMALRDKLENELTSKIPNSIINGKEGKRAPHITNISFINAEGEAIILNLDFEGIAVSSGSACTSGSLDPSHVLMAMGIPAAQAHGSIRFSLSRETTEEEIDKVIEILPGIIEKLRAMSPLK